MVREICTLLSMKINFYIHTTIYFFSLFTVNNKKHVRRMWVCVKIWRKSILSKVSQTLKMRIQLESENLLLASTCSVYIVFFMHFDVYWFVFQQLTRVSMNVQNRGPWYTVEPTPTSSHSTAPIERDDDDSEPRATCARRRCVTHLLSYLWCNTRWRRSRQWQWTTSKRDVVEQWHTRRRGRRKWSLQNRNWNRGHHRTRRRGEHGSYSFDS